MLCWGLPRAKLHAAKVSSVPSFPGMGVWALGKHSRRAGQGDYLGDEDWVQAARAEEPPPHKLQPGKASPNLGGVGAEAGDIRSWGDPWGTNTALRVQLEPSQRAGWPAWDRSRCVGSKPDM